MKHMKNMGFSEFRRESADSLFFHARLPQSDNFDLFAGLCLMICFLVALGKASGSYLYLCYLQTILVATTWTSLIVIDFVELSGIYSKDSSIPFHSIRISIHSDFLSPAISSLPFPAFFATKKWVSSFQNRHDGSPAKRWSTSALGLDCVCVFVCLFVNLFLSLSFVCLQSVWMCACLCACMLTCLRAFLRVCFGQEQTKTLWSLRLGFAWGLCAVICRYCKLYWIDFCFRKLSHVASQNDQKLISWFWLQCSLIEIELARFVMK